MKSESQDRPSIMARRAVSEMINLQRRIFEKQHQIIEASEAHPSSGFTRYRNEYKRSVAGYIAESGFGALCDAIALSRITYVADYHTLALAQRTFVKLIHGIMHQVDNICLAMEFIHIDYQKDLDKYLLGEINENAFLKRIRYKEQWPYDIWPNFRPIFELAIDKGFPVIAIDSNPGSPLTTRDKIAAKHIAIAADAYPDATILVYTGQMHLAPSHLPAAVDMAFVKEGMQIPRRVIVYQNAEEIYWQLAYERKEGLEVVQVNEESFCVNNTPPLVQQLSYLHWIQYDQELLEIQELEATVRSLIQHLGEFLDLHYRKAATEVRVLIPGDLGLMDALENSDLTNDEKQQIISLVEAEESACIPSLNAVYLATLSVNHAAEEAAHYLRYSVSNASPPKTIKDRFYFNVLEEALAFFGSKVINPKRKTDQMGKLRQIVAGARKKGGKQTTDERAAAFVLNHTAVFNGAKPNKKLWAGLTNRVVFNAAAHMIGYMLGEKLYYALTSGAISKDAIKTLFITPNDKPGEALRVYLELEQLLKTVKIPRRI